MNIAGVNTSVTGMIGEALSGPINKAVEIKSFSEFEAVFGKLNTSLELGYAVMLALENGAAGCWVVRTSDAHGSAKVDEALSAMDTVTTPNLVCVPGVSDAEVQAKTVEYCQKRKAFALFDADGRAGSAAALLQYAGSAALAKSDCAAMYGPWIKVPDPVTGTPRVSAPCGAVAGIYARNDAKSGVWHAPAGNEATVAGSTGVTFSISDAESVLLNNAGLSTIREFTSLGAVVWGARTRAGADSSNPEFKYISVKRMALFIEQSLTMGLQWTVFEPNGPGLWSAINEAVSGFLVTLFRQGAFPGSSAAQAFFVKCDATTTSQADLNTGVVNVEVGFAPLKPAEFVVIQIQLLACV